MARAFRQPMRRKEDPRLLTGRGTYAADFRLLGMLHAAVLRSPHAHARLGAVRAKAALALPGVVAVVTGDDLDAIGRIPPASATAAGRWNACNFRSPSGPSTTAAPTPRNPLGVKGVGEGGSSGGGAAIAKAVADAVAPLGATSTALPLTPERLRALVRSARVRGDSSEVGA